MPDTLLLASTSSSRQQLLRDAAIPFTLIGQSADESQCDWGLPLPQLVEKIALYKMEHALVPAGAAQGQVAFVLTADTLSEDANGVISGKPANRQEALVMLKAARGGMRTGTAFCLDRKVWQVDKWQLDKRIIQFVESHYHFNVPDSWLEVYLDQSLGLKASGAIAIEGYGSLFLQSVNGSYTAIVGLPIFEVREGLQKMGFKFF